MEQDTMTGCEQISETFKILKLDGPSTNAEFTKTKSRLTKKQQQPSPEYPSLCAIIMTRGTRKHQPCGQPGVGYIPGTEQVLCKQHLLFEQSKPYNPYVDKEFRLETLPDGLPNFLKTMYT